MVARVLLLLGWLGCRDALLWQPALPARGLLRPNGGERRVNQGPAKAGRPELALLAGKPSADEVPGSKKRRGRKSAADSASEDPSPPALRSQRGRRAPTEDPDFEDALRSIEAGGFDLESFALPGEEGLSP